MKLNKTQETELETTLHKLTIQRNELVEHANLDIVFLNGKINQVRELLGIGNEQGDDSETEE